MKIIQQSAEIVNKPDYQIMLSTVEQAIRNCYQSQSAIKDGSAEKIITSCIGWNHNSVLEFADITVKLIADRALLSQITRQRLATFCVSGDTIIPSFSIINNKTRSYGGGRKRTIKQLFEYYSTPQRKCAFLKLKLRSVDENLTIVENKPVKVFFNGNKDVFEVTTESGRKIKVTSNHKFFTKNGWAELNKLKPNDFVLVNGKELLDNEDWIRYNYLTLNKTRKQVANEIGCCEATLFKAFKKFNIVKPLSDRPNRKPGHGKKGMFSKEMLEKMRERSSGENNYGYKHNREEITEGSAYSEANRKFSHLKVQCEFCNKKENLEIHHIDKNQKNNNENNIKILCASCHSLWHHNMAIGAFFDKIVSIKHIGVEEVYDIEMEEPYHNYIANGFVVHNCVESMRYCNYSKDRFNHEIKVIMPENLTVDAYNTWEQSVKQAEENYFKMIEEYKVSAEVARSILPHCTATTIFMKANIREWRHIFTLRCDSHAQKDIRMLMTDVLDQFYTNYPVFFSDLYEKYVLNNNEYKEYKDRCNQ